MRFSDSKRLKAVAAACVLCASVGLSHAQQSVTPISSFLGKKSGDSEEVKSKPVAPADKDVPDWLRDSERLTAMLGDSADTKISNPKVIRKVETPIPGLDGFVVEADTVSTAHPDGKKELFVFYTDKTKRYLVVGMMIDMEKDRDLNMMVERYVRGETADNPAKALRPQDMHGVVLEGDPKLSPLTFVVDLGPEAGKKSLLGIARLHRTLATAKGGPKPRPVRIIPVSAGKDELSTGTMAMAMGFDLLSKDGALRLVEFAEKGASTSWVDSKRLKNDPELKKAIGMGIFRLDDNSTQALLAKIDTLPLIYVGEGEKAKNIPLPSSTEKWREILLQK